MFNENACAEPGMLQELEVIGKSRVALAPMEGVPNAPVLPLPRVSATRQGVTG